MRPCEPQDRRPRRSGGARTWRRDPASTTCFRCSSARCSAWRAELPRIAAHGLRLGLRQSRSTRPAARAASMRSRDPVPARSALPRRRGRQRRRPDPRLRGGRRRARPQGDGRPRHQPHGQRRAARRRSARTSTCATTTAASRAPSRSTRTIPASGTVWGDLAELDYHREAARGLPASPIGDGYIAALQELGVRGFRCDAAYKVPPDVWRDAHRPPPRSATAGCLFAAETLGCTFDETKATAARRLRLPLQQLRLVGPARALGARAATRRCALSRRRSPFPRTTTWRASPPTPATIREHVAARAQGALRAGGVLLDRRADADRLRVGLPARRCTSSRPRRQQRETTGIDISDFVAAINRLRAELPAANVEGAQWRLVGAGRAVRRAAAHRCRPPGGGASTASLVLANPGARRR